MAGRLNEAIDTCQDAAAIYREIGNSYGDSMALSLLGVVLYLVQRFDEAIAACQAAATICRETGDLHRDGMALNNLGNALRELRRFDEAITACQDAITMLRETGDRRGEAKSRLTSSPGLNSLCASPQLTKSRLALLPRLQGHTAEAGGPRTSGQRRSLHRSG
jgi:tetratricopeptide (TPR) repeat protein